jgi:hypothetical protein
MWCGTVQCGVVRCGEVHGAAVPKMRVENSKKNQNEQVDCSEPNQNEGEK